LLDVLKRQMVALTKRVRAEEARNDAVERAATATHARADLSDETLDDHEGRLEVVEEVTEIKHTITKQQDGTP
jgi:hypothetical protein